MQRRTFLTAVGGTAFALAAAVPARADDAVTLAIGQKGNWETAVAQLGTDAGLFRREHLELRMSYTAGGSDTIQAVVTGSADFGIGVGTTAAIAAYAKGAPIRIVAASSTGEPGIFYYVRADSPIKSFADCNGKSVGYTRPGSSTWLVARMLAQQAGVQPNYVSTGEIAATLTQVMSGQVDVGWSAPPFGAEQIADKKIRVIGTGQEARAIAHQTIRVHVGNLSFIRAHRDAAERFWRAYAATIAWMYGSPNGPIGAYARFADVPVPLVKDITKQLPRANMVLAPISEIERSVDDAVALKFIDKPLDASQIRGMIDLLAPTKR
jgi:NitT/TauT family transport system substrate-binding protein